MTILPQIEELEDIKYPSSDGKPMAESDITRFYLTYSVEALEIYFQNQPDVYVSGNSFIYYEQGKPASVIAPDVYVVLGVRKRQRLSYKFWKEGGIPPAFVLEITSATTQEEDQEIKPEIYRALGVREYFQYDPSGDYLNPILQGVRLVNGQYEPIPANVNSFDNLWLVSEVLGLELRVISGELRFRNPETGEFLRTHRELDRDLIQTQSALQESQEARVKAEQSLRNIVHQLLNSGLNLEQVAQMIERPLDEVRILVGE